MLSKNPLHPPRCFTAETPASPCMTGRPEASFVSAEDFDQTGILAGVDPCESRYWWLTELHEPTTAQGLAWPTGGASPSAD